MKSMELEHFPFLNFHMKVLINFAGVWKKRAEKSQFLSKFDGPEKLEIKIKGRDRNKKFNVYK